MPHALLWLTGAVFVTSKDIPFICLKLAEAAFYKRFSLHRANHREGGGSILYSPWCWTQCVSRQRDDGEQVTTKTNKPNCISYFIPFHNQSWGEISVCCCLAILLSTFIVHWDGKPVRC